ncbi:adenylate cyclase type 2-like isoform X1 [Penaeus indicus]|uniref:adenylate cyclase type 2-like isoform X1 n=2 Tax=Penaeus indicus TaxID=29960 RepID=UPI00300CEFC5
MEKPAGASSPPLSSRVRRESSPPARRPWRPLRTQESPGGLTFHPASLRAIHVSFSVGLLCNFPDAGGGADDEGILAGESQRSAGRSSIGSNAFDSSPRGSAGSLSNFERLEIMARKSLPYIQQRRQSSASAYIREPLMATTDDRNWSWRYLRERFRIKDLEDLFEHYQLRLHHAMFIVYLMLQLFLSFSAIAALFITQHPPEELVPELTGHGAALVVCMALLVYVYDERTFRQFPSLHVVMSGLIILTLFATDVSLTLYFHEQEIQGNEDKDVKFGNMIYLLLVVYVFLPIPKKWQVTVLALLLTLGYLALGYYAIQGDQSPYGRQHIVTKMCVDATILLCVNLVGIYWRFMSEVAFRRAFLDKRGNLESKFKLDAEKKQEEGLLLSILPKNIMQQVKSDFRNMIERTLYNTMPITKSNPFPNLYVNRHEMVSILYADIVNFTPLTTKLSVDQLVEMLNDLFGKFDESAETNGCLRIKILGDCYYCVCGVPEYNKDHAHNCVKVGFEMIDIIREVREERAVNVDMRIGIHSGSVLSGLIGVRKWQFDVWSNDVTIANHMEQTGRAGRVHVTHKTRELLTGLDYGFEPSDGRRKDQLLMDEKIDTFLIIPKHRPPSGRRVSYGFHSASIKPRVSMTVDSAELKNLYEGDISKKITKVNLPHGAARGSILARRRSTHSENHLASKRRTVVTDNALVSFQRIMVNSKEFMEKAIESMPLRKYDQWFKPEGINPLLLTFTKDGWELPLLRQPDPLYKYYILCAIFIFIVIFLTQQLLMPVNTWGWVAGVAGVLILATIGPVCWVATVHQQIVDPHNDREFDTRSRSAVTEFFYTASKSVIASIGLRALLFSFVCCALYSCAVVNVIECTDILEEYASTLLNTTAAPFGANASTELPLSPGDIPALCCDPWYFTYSVTLTLLVVWTFFRMHFLLKLSVYVVAVTLYGFFVLYFAEGVFSHEGMAGVCPRLTVTSLGLSPGLGHLFFVLFVFFALHVMDRQMEYIMRLDFQWKQQLEVEQKEAQTTHFANKLLLQNILPLHVADMYLNRQGATDELYHESYQHVGVIFASIPNYGEFYRENEMNEDGKMCLKVLNEIISDFDMLTYEAPFLTMEKIKVVGSTYMAACGLQPGRRYSDDSNFEERDKQENVATITKFAAAMFEKLKAMNREHLQEFRLRVGIDVGPVIAGVVGAHKPMYDIWGNTVNVASRMDYTGEMGKIHVTKEVGEILQEQGWAVECRGEIYVKGKGHMVTYFVDPTQAPPKASTDAHPEANNNENLNLKSSSHIITNNNSKASKDQDSGEQPRRRSSQLSLNSLKGYLTPHRGSIEISKGKGASGDSSSLSSNYRRRNDSLEDSREGRRSRGTSPRNSDDSGAPSSLQGRQVPPAAEAAVTAKRTYFNIIEDDFAKYNHSFEKEDERPAFPASLRIEEEDETASGSVANGNVESASLGASQAAGATHSASDRESVSTQRGSTASRSSSKGRVFGRSSTLRQVDVHPLALLKEQESERPAHTELSIDSYESEDIRL